MTLIDSLSEEVEADVVAHQGVLPLAPPEEDRSSIYKCVLPWKFAFTCGEPDRSCRFSVPSA